MKWNTTKEGVHDTYDASINLEHAKQQVTRSRAATVGCF